MIRFCKEIETNPTSLQIQTKDEIEKFVDSLDKKEKSIFNELFKICFTHSIEILTKDKEWYLKVGNNIIARTKSTKSKIELVIPIQTPSITLTMEYESIKNKELIIPLKDNPKVWEVVCDRLE